MRYYVSHCAGALQISRGLRRSKTVSSRQVVSVARIAPVISGEEKLERENRAETHQTEEEESGMKQVFYKLAVQT